MMAAVKEISLDVAAVLSELEGVLIEKKMALKAFSM